MCNDWSAGWQSDKIRYPFNFYPPFLSYTIQNYNEWRNFFISSSSFLVPRNSFVYRFSLVFSRHQFQVFMLQVLPTTTPQLQQTAAALPNVIMSSFHSVRYEADSTRQKQLKRVARHETREIWRFHMQTVMSWVGAYRSFEGTRSYSLQDMKYLVGSSVALLPFSRYKVWCR